MGSDAVISLKREAAEMLDFLIRASGKAAEMLAVPITV